MNKTAKQAKSRLKEIESTIESLQKEKDELTSAINTSVKTKEEVFRDMWTGCTIMPYDEKYPDSVFFFKGEKYYFEIEKSNLWCSWKNVWSVFGERFDMNYDEIQSFIKDQVENHFKMKGVTPRVRYGYWFLKVENHFKMKGVTPQKENKILQLWNFT